MANLIEMNVKEMNVDMMIKLVNQSVSRVSKAMDSSHDVLSKVMEWTLLNVDENGLNDLRPLNQFASTIGVERESLIKWVLLSSGGRYIAPEKETDAPMVDESSAVLIWKTGKKGGRFGFRQFEVKDAEGNKSKEKHPLAAVSVKAWKETKWFSLKAKMATIVKPYIFDEKFKTFLKTAIKKAESGNEGDKIDQKRLDTIVACAKELGYDI